jgi:hypothetical protein
VKLNLTHAVDIDGDVVETERKKEKMEKEKIKSQITCDLCECVLEEVLIRVLNVVAQRASPGDELRFPPLIGRPLCKKRFVKHRGKRFMFLNQFYGEFTQTEPNIR